ncbi:MAG: response regulator [Deltaproteobacteria bacterium]|nr:response regulator [Deltaproteobacteria bacterium]
MKKVFSLQCTCILLTLLVATAGCSDTQKPPQAVKGVLDLSGWDYAKNKVVSLDGEWDFYWKQLLGPDDFTQSYPSPEGSMHLPGFWNQGQKGKKKKLPRDGFATFRLRVTLPELADAPAIKIGSIQTAYKLWVNSRLVASVGSVGTKRSDVVPFREVRLVELNKKQKLDIVLQVANFHYPLSGVADRILLGSVPALERNLKARFVFGLLLFGCLCVIGLYHIKLFVLRPADHTPLYFGLCCISVAAAWQGIDIHARCIDLLMPDLTWTAYSRIDLLGYYLGLPFFFMIFQALFPQETSRIVGRLFIAAAVGFSLIVVLTPGHVFTRTLPVFEIVSLLCLIYVLKITITAVVRKRDGSLCILIGLLVVIATGINDALYEYNVIQSVWMAPLGLLGMVMLYAFVLSLNYAKAFHAVETLSGELKEKNIELSRMDRIKDEFLANTTHELKTPLSGIIGITESLIRGAAGRLSEKARDNLTMVASSGKRLAHLINDVLDFSRLSNRDMPIKKSPVDIRALTDVILTVTEHLMHDRGQAGHIILKNDIPEGLPPVLGDENRLQQVMYNLVGNSVKFTEKGEICISAVLHDTMLALSVKDTGIGIPEEDFDRIFNVFEQADGTAARQYSGTGLGLSITKHLIQLHGGDISVESTPGKGSSFTFTLPVCDPSIQAEPEPPLVSGVLPDIALAAATTAPATKDNQPQAETDSAGVLVVDDDRVNLQVVVNYMALRNITTRTCTGGAEALEDVARNGKPDLVLLDIMMPGMSGYEVCRKLRETWPAQELPIIMLTARNRIQDLVEGFEAGAGDYLVKPFTGEELMARVDTHLKITKAYQTLRENVRLKKELDRRKETEHELRRIQQRLSGMLDTVDSAMLGVNEVGEIGFCNQLFEAFIGQPSGSLLGVPLVDLIAEDSWQQVQHLWEPWAAENDLPADQTMQQEILFKSSSRQAVACSAVNLDLEEERLLVLILRQQQSPHTAFALIDTLNANRRRIRNLEDSLNGMTPHILEHHPEFIEELRSVDTSLRSIQMRCSDDAAAEEPGVADLIVQVMNLAVACWIETTGETKADLAVKSGLWKMYMTRDGHERTQTLDKYLDLATLPKNPRRRQVIQTAEFVLSVCGDESPKRAELSSALSALQELKT